jgi:hypothetical protein
MRELASLDQADAESGVAAVGRTGGGTEVAAAAGKAEGGAAARAPAVRLAERGTAASADRLGW